MENKNPLEIIKRPAAYASGYENIPTEAQDRAKQLCWEYNRTQSYITGTVWYLLRDDRH